MDKQAILAALPEVIPQAFTEDAEWAEDPQRADQRLWRGPDGTWGAGGGGGGSQRGGPGFWGCHDGICESWEVWLSQWEDYSFEVGRIEDHGDKVFVTTREEGRGLASGAEVSADNYIVLSFREGKIA